MKAFLALVWHEIRERRALLAAAAVASVLPVLSPLLPTTGSNPPADTREAVMWFMVRILIPIFALLLGGGFIGRDLSEGRLGFYFAQPLSGVTIWFGKLTAVVVLIWTAQLVVMLPTALLSEGPGRILAARIPMWEPVDEWVSIFVIWIGPLMLVLLAHALGIVWKARSVWIVADVVALVIVIGAVRYVESPFLQIFAAKLLIVILGWMVFATLVGLVAAGAAQVTVGRVDARRGHRALSVVLWSVLTVAVLVAAVWGRWVRSASPSDLARVNEISVGSGEWIAVTGPSAGRFDYYPGFLVNTDDGRWVLAHSGSIVHKRGPVFSSDQSLAVWTEPSGPKEMRLMAVELNDQPLAPKWTGVVIKRNAGDMVCSPTGDRVALIQGSIVEVYNIRTGELVVAAKVADGDGPCRLCFVNENVVSILSGRRVPSPDDSAKKTTLWEKTRLDLNTKSLDDGEAINNPWRWRGFRQTSAVPGNLERESIEGDDRLLLVDSNDGGVVADLGEMPGQWTQTRAVSHGEIVVKRKIDDRDVLDVFDSEGVPLRTIDIGQGKWIDIGGEPVPGILAVGETVWADDSFEPNKRATTLVNVASGEISDGPENVSPVLSRWGLTTSPGAWEVGSVATRLMWGKNGSLHLWDPETNELKQIIPIPD